jgi:YfiH family protein
LRGTIALLNELTNALAEQALVKNQWPIVTVNNLPLLQSPLLAEETNLIHAFTTRNGGESVGPLASFNLGRHQSTEESRDDAMNNRRKLCQALGLNFEKLVVPAQVHSPNIIWVSEVDGLENVRTGADVDIAKLSLGNLDGAATTISDLPLLLHFADCVPIILYERKLRAVAVLHAGWKGTAQQIVKHCVDQFQTKLGSDPADIISAIGPAIGRCCYPVGDDVSAKLAQTVANAEGLISQIDDKSYPDLQAINAMQLLECGVGRVDVSANCTACQPEVFYSHRRFQGNTGRQGAIASLKESR